VADRLVAWLHDTPVAVLIRGPEFRIQLEWCPDGIERWGRGSPALSVGLPIGAPIGPRDLRGLDFFENILPEGPALERMAALARVRPADTYGILAAFGRDCAGAIMVLPAGDRPGGNAGRPMRADTHLGQRVGGQADVRKVTVASLIDEAVTWGIRRRVASAVVAETLDQVLAAISTTSGDARVLDVIREQAERISRN
jgi:serine/threonine-protein kinase HipA